MTLLLFLLGLAALVAGAELLVRGASRLALSFGISPLVVGLTIVAFGTSAPEVAVSLGAVADGTTDLAIGNVVGSNIFNVLLILGLAAVISPLCVHVQVIRQEVPMMIGAALVLVALVLDGRLSRGESGLLLALLVVYTVYLIRQSRAAAPNDLTEYEKSAPHSRWDSHWAVQLLLVGGGLALLVFGADWLVAAAVSFAKALGVSDLVIGLTIVAAGTSMPEVATSVMATLRGERDIAVGNVIGSNLFNILGCLGLSGAGRGRGAHGARLGAELRSVGDDRDRARLPAGVHDRPRDRPLGGRGLPRLLRGLHRLPDPRGAGARCAAGVFAGDDELRHSADDRDAGRGSRPPPARLKAVCRPALASSGLVLPAPRYPWTCPRTSFR